MEMMDKVEKIQRFLSICDELVTGSYITAEGKISEALKEIAGCRELTNLFTAVTDGFDYPTAKKAYLRPRTGTGSAGRVGAYLPAERQDVLAFVFCLFVEIDAGTVHMNDLLLRYFYVDGSYTASYSVFSGRMIKPFRDIVRECFPECGKHGQLIIQRKRREETLSRFSALLPSEQARVMGRALLDEEKTAGEEIFSELSAAAARRDIAEIRALMAGYRYFLRYINAESQESAALFDLAKNL